MRMTPATPPEEFHFPDRAAKTIATSAFMDILGSCALSSFYTVNPAELSVKCLLGSGAQAEVYKAEWKRKFLTSTSSIVVAVKQLHSDMGPLYRDREALTRLTDHPNLVKCFDATLEAPYLIVTDFCAGGSLFNLLYNSDYVLTARQQIKSLADVATALVYLHSHQPPILHRDLKSSNVLLTRPIISEEQEPFAKLADFGLSRTSSDSQPLTAGVGTWGWMAPEVFHYDDVRSYDERADVFSFAMLMYEALAQKLPYMDNFPAGCSDPRIGMHVCLGLRPNVLDVLPEHPLSLTDIMQRGWAGDPSLRPTILDIHEEISMTLASMEMPDPF
jgi:serine/threonine protein kinase